MGKRGRGTRGHSSEKKITLLAQGKGSVKRTQINPYDAAGSDEIEYSVREIKAERVRGTTTQLLIGWDGFTYRDDTWEPIAHLAGYEGEIRAFRPKQKEENAELEAENIAKKKHKKEVELANACMYFLA